MTDSNLLLHYAVTYIALSFIVLFQGIFQIAGKNQRSSLNWHFFAICAALAVVFFNNSIQFYTAFSEGVDLGESSYISGKLSMFFSPIKLMIIPFVFAFILNLSKIKSKGTRILHLVLLSTNTLVVSAIYLILLAFTDAFEILSSNLFNLSVLLIVIFSGCCLIILQYKWIKSASLKRDRLQAKSISIVSLISLLSLVLLLFIFGSHWTELIAHIGIVALIFICSHFAREYNSFSFNISNLAAYVYTAVKLPVLILDDTGNIMLCNKASEMFFKKDSGQLTLLKLFSLFDFGDISLTLQRHKKDASVFNCDAVCLAEGQKCQISLNYIYDKYDEMICTVVIVTDVTEKEDLIRQINESHARIERFNKELQSEVDRQTKSIRDLQRAIVYSMSDLIEKKDGYTGAHTRRVSEYVSILLRELVRRGYQLTESEIQKIAESSLLHDMGKIAIPDNILLKDGKLTDDEFAVMKSHSMTGADSLQKSMQFAENNDFLKNAFVMAKYHHEKWNGSGYPDGKKENEIPVLARVIAIADVYDALRSQRPYKAPFSREKAKSIILEENGLQFDPELVDVFLAVEPEFDEFCTAIHTI
ncbi:MAG: HD domain-containing protein [Spirochaetota bacterium]|nr:HD domain-containing protein [Spirochaetota bacterium]